MADQKVMTIADLISGAGMTEIKDLQNSVFEKDERDYRRSTVAAPVTAYANLEDMQSAINRALLFIGENFVAEDGDTA